MDTRELQNEFEARMAIQSKLAQETKLAQNGTQTAQVVACAFISMCAHAASQAAKIIARLAQTDALPTLELYAVARTQFDFVDSIVGPIDTDRAKTDAMYALSIRRKTGVAKDAGEALLELALSMQKLAAAHTACTRTRQRPVLVISN